MTLLVSLASHILNVLTFAHFSCFRHIYNNNTSTLYHLAWEFEKPFIISFVRLRFIQPKIMNYLLRTEKLWMKYLVGTLKNKQLTKQ